MESMNITIEKTSELRDRLETDLRKLISLIGPIQIGNRSQFPYGWRKAAKGRTVWRILEEAINQNLEYRIQDIGVESVLPSDSEVSVYDTKIIFENESIPAFMNVKSSVKGGRSNKDDISKAVGLKAFYDEDKQRQLFVSTFEIEFKDDMSIEFTKCVVMPVAWLPDVYVNPSNNGNLQSSKYKAIDLAVKRTSCEFYDCLMAEMEVARQKRIAKQKQ